MLILDCVQIELIESGRMLKILCLKQSLLLNHIPMLRSRTTTVSLGHGLNDMDKNVEDMQQDTTFLQPNLNIDDLSTAENFRTSTSLSGQLEPTSAKYLFMTGQPIAGDSCCKQHKERISSTKDLITVRTYERHKRKVKSSTKDIRRTHEQQKGKAITCSQNLEEAGTYWESVVRRSKRIRTRPLEYWKGLTTVIGTKSISPTESLPSGLLCMSQIYTKSLCNWHPCTESITIDKEISVNISLSPYAYLDLTYNPTN